LKLEKLDRYFAIVDFHGQVLDGDGTDLFRKSDPFWLQDHSPSIAEDDRHRLARILCDFDWIGRALAWARIARTLAQPRIGFCEQPIGL